MAVVAGDTVWVVLAHIGSGEVVGCYSTLALANSAVGSSPGCTYRIIPVVVELEGGMVPQFSRSPVLGGIGPIPRRNGIKDGKPDR